MIVDGQPFRDYSNDGHVQRLIDQLALAVSQLISWCRLLVLVALNIHPNTELELISRDIQRDTCDPLSSSADQLAPFRIFQPIHISAALQCGDDYEVVLDPDDFVMFQIPIVLEVKKVAKEKASVLKNSF